MNKAWIRSTLAVAFVMAMLVPHARAQESGFTASESRSIPLDGAVSLSQHASECASDNVFLSLARSQPGFEVNASLLYLQPLSGNLAYATLVTPFPFVTPHWADQTVNPDLTPAFNVGIRYDFGCGTDMRLDWTSLNSHDSAGAQGIPIQYTANVPTSTGTVPVTSFIQALGPPFLIGPPPQFTQAQAELHFAYDAVNWDVGLLINAGSHAHLRLFAGLEGARIGQTFSGTFQNPDNSIAFNDNSRSVFTGVGPRLGIDAHCTYGQFDFLLGLAGATLIGGAQNNIAFTTNSPYATGFPINSQYLTTPTATRVVPSIDARLGASYTLPAGRFGSFKCEAGYQAAVYFNAVSQFTISEVLDSLTETAETSQFSGVFLRTASEQQSNFLMHGPYVKLALDF